MQKSVHEKRVNFDSPPAPRRVAENRAVPYCKRLTIAELSNTNVRQIPQQKCGYAVASTTARMGCDFSMNSREFHEKFKLQGPSPKYKCGCGYSWASSHRGSESAPIVSSSGNLRPHGENRANHAVHRSMRMKMKRALFGIAAMVVFFAVGATAQSVGLAIVGSSALFLEMGQASITVDAAAGSDCLYSDKTAGD